ncbi:MAG: hypothetical protein ACKOCJ_10355 [Burkholderiaceae bacterium]
MTCAETDGSIQSNTTKAAIPRSGSCPGGYYATGNYCVASR